MSMQHYILSKLALDTEDLQSLHKTIETLSFAASTYHRPSEGKMVLDTTVRQSKSAPLTKASVVEIVAKVLKRCNFSLVRKRTHIKQNHSTDQPETKVLRYEAGDHFDTMHVDAVLDPTHNHDEHTFLLCLSAAEEGGGTQIRTTPAHIEVVALRPRDVLIFHKQTPHAGEKVVRGTKCVIKATCTPFHRTEFSPSLLSQCRSLSLCSGASGASTTPDRSHRNDVEDDFCEDDFYDRSICEEDHGRPYGGSWMV